MDSTLAPSCSTQLNDRKLWYDGDSTFDATRIYDQLGKYDIHFVDQLTPAVIQYNNSVRAADKLSIKQTLNPLEYQWQIPDRYLNLDLVQYFSSAHAILTEGMDPSEIERREERLVQELMIYRRLKLEDVLRTVIWIINRLTEVDVVWGIGRGSSTSSYVLYIAGVHDVDSFAYDLDIEDFLRE